MKTEIVSVNQEIKVTVDETKFTPEFMENFRKYFYDFETVYDHIKHIASCYARGIIGSKNDHLEGYGCLVNYGIEIKQEYADSEIL